MKHVKMGSAQDLLDSMPKERVYNPDRKYTRFINKLTDSGFEELDFGSSEGALQVGTRIEC